MNKIAVILSLGLVAVLLGGCSSQKNSSPMPSISDETKAELARPVNCRTAQSDIAILESERASTGRQILSGVRAVMPVAAVVGLLSGDYNDRVKVASGSYNDALAAKIDEIKSRCGIN